MAGLTPTGFDKKSRGDCLQETKSAIWSTVSSKMDLSTESPMGQTVGIFADREAALWDAVEAVHDARKPDSASGSALKALCLLTGTPAQSATATLVKGCTVNVDAGFDAAAGTMFASLDTDPTKVFTNKAEVKNTGAVAADVDADFVCLALGAVACPAGHLVVKATSLSGWNSITNPLDGVVGLDDDTDATLRVRREEDLQGGGSTTADAIRSDVLRNLSANITNCTVLSNETDDYDADGLPPHSFEVVARGQATDTNAGLALANQIFASKAAEDQTVGSTSVVVQDDEGNDHTVAFTWVSDLDVYFVLQLQVNAKTFPIDGDTQVQNAILAVGASYDPGDPVIAERIKAACFTVIGVVDVPSLKLDVNPSPTATANLIVGKRQCAKFDTSRISISHV